ncbi:hypothetical protein F5Y19DRAFT_450156 [Xylariaceae sp. FL1651]|nr:hypothetical protein F5Y19DRAFT_450156 [Xylariaceae sp. FL1651]
MEELSQTVLVVSIVLILLTALAVGIRFWSRFDTVRILGLDDGLVFFSWIASIVVCSSIAAATRYGLGVHHNKVPIPEYETFLKIQIATSVSYSLGVTSAKASFAILYLRLFPVRSLMILNKAVVIFLLCQAIEESLVVPFRCSPIKKSWIPDLEGYCFDLHPLWYTTFAFNLTTDIILFIEPMLIVWRLQMPLVKRIALVVMLSLGVL